MAARLKAATKALRSMTEEVGRVMTPNPITVKPSESLDIALALMVSCRFRHLPVAEDRRLMGMISLGDLYAADLSHVTSSRGARGLHLRQILVQEIMHTDTVTTTLSAPQWDAAQLLLKHAALPVLEREQLVGIVTRTDFLPMIADLLKEEASARTQVPTSTLMSPWPLVVAKPDDTLDVARSLMVAHKISHLPVLDGDHVVGMLSDHDLLAAEGTDSSDNRAEVLMEHHHLTVRQAMSERVVMIRPDRPALEAVELFEHRRLGSIPVVSHGHLVGTVSVTDLFHYLLTFAPNHLRRE